MSQILTQVQSSKIDSSIDSSTEENGLICPWFDQQFIFAKKFQSTCRIPNQNAWSFYLPDFFLEETDPWWNFEQVKVSSGMEVDENFFSESKEEVMTSRISSEWRIPAEEVFFSQVASAQELMHQSFFKKVVPVVVAQQEGHFCAEWVLSFMRKLKSLSQWNQTLFPYGFWRRLASLGDGEAMLGLTPELLVSYRKGVLSCMALAGTKKSGFSPGALLQDPKERREHQLVIEGICSQLEYLGTLTQGETEERNLGSLTHLCTPLEIELSHVSDDLFENLIKQLHPTPALGGWPKNPSWEWLKKNRSRDAYRFGAPFGARSPQGEFFIVVAIRNLEWRHGQIFLTSGCGIIKESQAQKEWKELALKRQWVMENLGICH